MAHVRKPVTIWIVRQCDEFYGRSVNGRTSDWFRGSQVHHEGWIWAHGVKKDVIFVEADPSMNAQIVNRLLRERLDALRE